MGSCVWDFGRGGGEILQEERAAGGESNRGRGGGGGGKGVGEGECVAIKGMVLRRYVIGNMRIVNKVVKRGDNFQGELTAKSVKKNNVV